MGTEKPSEMSWATLTLTREELEKEILMAIANLGRLSCPKVAVGRIEKMVDMKHEFDREILFRLAKNNIAPSE